MLSEKVIIGIIINGGLINANFKINAQTRFQKIYV